MKPIIRSLVIAMAFFHVIGLQPAMAQMVGPAEMEAMAARLELTDTQRSAVEPVIVDGMNERQAILQSAGIVPGQKPTLAQVMSIRGPMRASRQRTEDQLKAILSPQQMAEYRIIVEETRASLLARLQQ